MVLSSISGGLSAALDKIIYTRKKTDETYERHLNELISSIEYTKSELKCAMENFNNVTEPRLIDFYIYKIQSEQNHYDQLICEYKMLKNRG